jgi:hypothetical protein
MNIGNFWPEWANYGPYMRMGQLLAKMGMGKTTNAKLQINGQLWVKYDESQQWVEMGMGFKQYHKGWV